MGSFFRFVGKVLFLALFIGAGVDKITAPQKVSGFLVQNYRKFYQLANSHVALNSLPEFVQPKFVELHQVAIIQYTGYFLVSVGALILLGLDSLSFLYSGFITACILIFWNPLYEDANQVSALNSQRMFIYDLALLGVSLMLCFRGHRVEQQKIDLNRKSSDQQQERQSQSKQQSQQSGNKKGQKSSQKKRD